MLAFMIAAIFIVSLDSLVGSMLFVVSRAPSRVRDWRTPFSAGGFISIALGDMMRQLHQRLKGGKIAVQLNMMLIGLGLMGWLKEGEYRANQRPEKTLTFPFLRSPPRYLFSTGKGGLGETSLACAAAVALADRNLKVLAVSTDPDSNLDTVLGIRLSKQPRPVTGVPGLRAMNIDPEQAASAYRERTLAPYPGRPFPWPSLPCWKNACQEPAQSRSPPSMNLPVSLIAGSELGALDDVIFDTAPAGHTLRLLQPPGAWTGFLEDSGGESCLGPLAGLKSQQSRYAETVRALADGGEDLAGARGTP